jgi:CRISPR-associated protein Cmr2
LESSYGVSAPDNDWLQEARKTLSAVYQATKRPSPYYAIIALDGDDVGQWINTCLTQSDPQQAHEQFSRQLAAFSAQVKEIVPSLNGSLIYNGGDDVLVLAPLRTAFGLAAQLATQFKQVTGGTASAGLAVVHHLYPLGAALQAARAAERQAKQVTGKNAVCVRVLKRSGEVVEMRSPWNAVGNTLVEIVRLFKGDIRGTPLSSKFAYDVLHAAYALPEANEKGQAELRHLLTRHRNPKHPQVPHPDEWAQRLKTWAADLPQQLEELGRWLVFARFVAQEGSE